MGIPVVGMLAAAEVALVVEVVVIMVAQVETAEDFQDYLWMLHIIQKQHGDTQ